MESWFKFKERGTTFSTELLAGFTTFIAMVYITIVNPAILSKTGMDFNGVFIATIAATVAGTLIMGVFANLPIAIAPGMGINAYFTFSVVLGMGLPWQQALGAVFVSSCIFILLSLTEFRNILIDAIPESLKHAITAGIGLFITFIGLQNAKIIINSPTTLVTMGNLSNPTALLSVIGITLSLILMVYKVHGYLFIGMFLTALIAYFNGMLNMPEQFFVLPTGLTSTFLQMDIHGVFSGSLYAVIFTVLLITLFDTTGTMISVAEQAGLIKNGKFPRVKSALLADAVGSAVGAIFGSSPTSAYVESSAGVAVGGRTGFTSVVVAILFTLTLFCAPIAKLLASAPAITSPTLILIGFFMMNGLNKINWNDIEEGLPAFLVMFMLPLTYSIAVGIGIGFIVYPLIKVLKGKAKTVHPLLYVFQILFIIQIGFLTH